MNPTKEHVLTQEDIDKNPTYAAQGLEVGDVIRVPVDETVETGQGTGTDPLPPAAQPAPVPTPPPAAPAAPAAAPAAAPGGVVTRDSVDTPSVEAPVVTEGHGRNSGPLA